MDVTTFQCPHCQAMLRMRRQQLADTRFPCPDCDQPLQVTQTTEGEFSISAISATPTRKDHSHLLRSARVFGDSLHRYGRFLITSPVLMSWLVAGTGAFLILLLILFDQSSSPQSSRNETVAKVIEASETTLKKSVNTEPSKLDQREPVPPALATPKQNGPAPQPEIPVRPEPIKPAAPVVQEEFQELIAAKPEDTPPLNARKPQLAQPLPALEIDVNVALQIPIVEFRQPTEVPLKQMMSQLEEMLGTEFQFAENVKNDERLMETPISFSLKKTTLSDLLKRVLSEVALTFSVKSNKIYIQKTEASFKPDQSVRN
ncbi:DUF4974 domain-containing protein [Gimesia aquarii]|uniref:Uncharacterized protein n=1 Tax=Gimesia aquarii TaxID=2527964 RepID=A0A517WPD8_9PLAN|nr:DUF4974 domain-containing protein [Gimesia aquarii]QDU07123.1 hypothetical protein V202x_04730 [Gimesia aquarii]